MYILVIQNRSAALFTFFELYTTVLTLFQSHKCDYNLLFSLVVTNKDVILTQTKDVNNYLFRYK